MSMLISRPPYLAAASFLSDLAGRECVCVIVKSSFAWNQHGAVTPVEQPAAIVHSDVYCGQAAAGSGLLIASEVTLPKPRVDVLLRGRLAQATAVPYVDVKLELGHQLKKTARVFGDRYWHPGLFSSWSHSAAQPFVHMPFEWERCCGGTDLAEPRNLDAANPAGCTRWTRGEPRKGQRLPNFEDPQHLFGADNRTPAPKGFGPVAPHWRQRQGLAGTYDDDWKKTRFPLLPSDFDPRFFNVAPLDQQIDHYVPGTIVRLTGLTVRGVEQFVLPPFEPDVTCVTRSEALSEVARVDTIVIEPEERRCSLVARAVLYPRPTIESLKQIFIGDLTAGQELAIETGKYYLAGISTP